MKVVEFPRKPKKLVIKTQNPDGSTTESEATLADVWVIINDKIDFEVCKLERAIHGKRRWPHVVAEMFVLASFLGNFAILWFYYAKHVLGWNI